MGFGEVGELVQSAVQLVRADRCPFTDLCGLHVEREVRVRSAGSAPGPVAAGEAGQRGDQRAVVLQRFGHLVVEALVVLALDTVGAELDSLGDQQSGAGVAVVVGELSTPAR